MMNLIFDEKVLQSEQMENQITILHSAIKQQKQEHERHLKVNQFAIKRKGFNNLLRKWKKDSHRNEN